MFKSIGVSISLAFSVPAAFAHAQMFAGSWTGTASHASETTRIRININEGDGAPAADVDLLDIGVTGWPAIDVDRDEGGFVVTIPSDSGPQQLRLTYTAGDRVRGEWTDNSAAGAALVQLQYSGPVLALDEARTRVAGIAGDLGVSVILPVGEPARAGVVLVHGSGAQSRDASRFDAQMFAEAGFAAAFYDKRGVGESEGDWLQADFDDLAADAAAVAAHLELVSGLPSERIGFVGYSQGGWISPLALARRSGEGFVVSIAGPATTPAEEGMWHAILSLREAGYGNEVQDTVRSILSDWNDGVRAGGDFERFEQRRAAVRSEDWFEMSRLGDFETQGLSPQWLAWYQAVLDFDPVPVIRANDAPFLSLMGDQDEEQPWDRSQALFEGLQEEGVPVEVFVYPGVNHAMRLAGIDGQAPRWPGRPGDFYQRQFDFIDRALSD